MAMVSTPSITPSTTCNLLSVQLSTKYNLRMSNLCAQHDTVAELKHCHAVNCTVLQLTATKGTYTPIVTHTILKWVKLGENQKMPDPQCGRSIKTWCQTMMMPGVSQSMGF